MEDEDSDIGDEALFNLEDDDGEAAPALRHTAPTHHFPDDVFDDETAYLEMLAKEASELVSIGTHRLTDLHRTSASGRLRPARATRMRRRRSVTTILRRSSGSLARSTPSTRTRHSSTRSRVRLGPSISW
jgi:hypothetical protein